jgi:hypothetical protein
MTCARPDSIAAMRWAGSAMTSKVTVSKAGAAPP